MVSPRLLFIVGSLRSGSVNAVVASAAQELVGTDVDVVRQPIGDIPLYNGDIEADGLPGSVASLHEQAIGADGIVFFTPEYNSSFPAVTKNVIDWFSRPPVGWTDKAVTAVATTPGRRAGAGVLGHFEQSLSHMPVRLFETFGIGSYHDKLDEAGAFADEVGRAELADFLSRFVEFATARPESARA